jgi:hypothetical protein
MSAPPPGASGIMKRTGRDGNSCADVGQAPAAAQSAAAENIRALTLPRGYIVKPKRLMRHISSILRSRVMT